MMTTQTSEKVLRARCFKAGHLTIGTSAPPMDREGRTVDGDAPGGGGLAHYTFKSAEALHKCAARYDWVHRPGGMTRRGVNYTLRMAESDYA